MLFIFRKLRRSFFLPGKVRTYCAYAAGEIALIVVGILLALQISEWNQQRKNDVFETEILENLRADFIKNQGLLIEMISAYEFNVEGANKLADSIGPEPKSVTNTEIDELILALTYRPEYKPSDGVILSILDSDILSLIENAKIRQLIRSWPSRINDYKQSIQTNITRTDQGIFPFLSKHYAFRNIDSPFHRNDEDNSRFEVNYTDLLSNREFENHVELRRVNAVQLLDISKSLSEYQQQLLDTLEEELKEN